MFKSRSQKYRKPFGTTTSSQPPNSWVAKAQPIDPPGARMTLFCMNCGKNNHGYNQCQEPLSSYGIICFYRKSDSEVATGTVNPEQYQVVMVRRKHTMNYVEFLRGKYEVSGADYLVELFSGMTRTEIEFITQNPNFEVLRRDIGMDNNWKRAYKAEYDNSELKFNYILNLGILANIIRAVNYIWCAEFPLIGNTELEPITKFWGAELSADGSVANWGARLIELRAKFNPIGSDGTRGKLHEEPEWGIPKGRRDNKETDLQCAIREFQEETQLTDNTITIYKNIMPLEEVYVGNNGIKYRHIYFIGELEQEIRPSYASVVESGSQMETNGFSTNREISGVQTFDQHAALSILREHCVEKKKILQKAFYIINNVNNFFTRQTWQ